MAQDNPITLLSRAWTLEETKVLDKRYWNQVPAYAIKSLFSEYTWTYYNYKEIK
jgi:hypothetical protein